MNWAEFFSFLVVATLFAGTIYGCIQISKQVSTSIAGAKESLKAKGMNYEDGKLSIKSNRRFDREQEIDATQRSLINSMKAASFGKADETNKLPVMERQSSMSSARVSVHEVDPEEKERKSRLRKKA